MVIWDKIIFQLLKLHRYKIQDQNNLIYYVHQILIAHTWECKDTVLLSLSLMVRLSRWSRISSPVRTPVWWWIRSRPCTPSSSTPPPRPTCSRAATQPCRTPASMAWRDRWGRGRATPCSACRLDQDSGPPGASPPNPMHSDCSCNTGYKHSRYSLYSHTWEERTALSKVE